MSDNRGKRVLVGGRKVNFDFKISDTKHPSVKKNPIWYNAQRINIGYIVWYSNNLKSEYIKNKARKYLLIQILFG